MTDLPADIDFSPDFADVAAAALVPARRSCAIPRWSRTASRAPACRPATRSSAPSTIRGSRGSPATSARPAPPPRWNCGATTRRRRGRHRQRPDGPVPPARNARRRRAAPGRGDRHPGRLCRRRRIERGAGAERRGAVPGRARAAAAAARWRRRPSTRSRARRNRWPQAIIGDARFSASASAPAIRIYMTLRALKVLRRADRLVHFAKKGRRGNARDHRRRVVAADPAREIAARLPGHDRDRRGRPRLCGRHRRRSTKRPPRASRRFSTPAATVAVLCEGDPFFYGSFMHLLAAAGAALPDRGRAGHHRHVGLLDARRRTDHLGRRRADRLPGDAERGRARASACAAPTPP